MAKQQLGSLYKKTAKGKKSKKWYGAYVDSRTGERVVRALYPDKVASRKALNDLVEESNRSAAGVIDRFAKWRKTLLADHIRDYLDDCEHEGQVARHIHTKTTDLNRMIKQINAVWLSDLEPNAVKRHLHTLKKQDLSNRKVNIVRANVVALVNWCVANGRCPDNPLSMITKLNEDLDKRRERRAYTDEEIVLLLNTAEKRSEDNFRRCNRGVNKGKLTNKVTDAALAKARAQGQYKRQVYSFAVQTGLRRNEIIQLRWSDIDLTAMSIKVRIEVGKADREDEVPIMPDLLPELVNYKPDGVKPTDLVFPHGITNSTAFNLDLDHAGIVRKNEQNQYVDFHALRHTTATNLVRAGMLPMDLKDFMRHSRIETTMKFYVHTNMKDMHAAISRLVPIGQAKTSLKFTGAAGA